MNDQIIQKITISFACPDCEFGILSESEFGHVPHYFVCDSCHSSVVYSKKTYSYIHRKAFKIPSIKQSADHVTTDNVSDHSSPSV